MNINQTNTGAVNSAVTNELNEVAQAVVVPKRGRKIDPNKTRKIYLVKQDNNGVITYTQRTKGAPKPNTETYFVNIQRNVKSKDFVFNPETMKVETEIVKARVYKVKAPAVPAVVTLVESSAAPQIAPESVSVHNSVSATVTQSENEIVVDSAVAA